MNTRYFSNSRNHRIAVLLLAGMAAFGSVKAQTYTNGTIVQNNSSVIHKQGYIANRAEGMAAFPPEFLQKGDGMKANAYSGIQVQNVSEYYTTRYVKHNTWSPLFLTTNNGGTNSQHTNYQRWYYYNGNQELPLHDGIYNSNNRAFVYANGLVMGSGVRRIGNNNNTEPVTHYINAQLPNGQERLVIGADLSRYSDLAYENNQQNGGTSGDLTEPSLTLRHYFELIDANVMARRLTSMTNGGDNWLEEHTIHFPNRRISANYNTIRADLVPLELELQDYWFYTTNNTANQNDNTLQNITSDTYVVIEIGNNTAGIRNASFINAPDNPGLPGNNGAAILRRRLVQFEYPESGLAPADSRAEIRVYARTGTGNNARRFQLAKFTLIFDDNSEVLPWMDIVGANARAELHGRSPQGLREIVGGKDPVAHIDFDYPKGQTFVTPPTGTTTYPGGNQANRAWTNSSALPLDPKKSSYAYAPFGDNVWNWCVWGEYGVGNHAIQGLNQYPVSQRTGEVLNDNLESGFLYIDASDLPGTVASVPFIGTFCRGTKMMCSGWMSAMEDASHVPGSVILKVIGTDADGTQTEIYSFCPGQIGQRYRRYGTNTLTQSTGEYCWQQFYFEFFLDELYTSYDLRIENNCASTNGGDYFLDDVWVFAQLPNVGPEMSTPLCGGNLNVIQLATNFEPLLQATGYAEATSATTAQTGYLSFIYLDWDNFLLKFQQGLATLGEPTSGDLMIERINNGYYADVDRYKNIYKAAFENSILREGDDNHVIYGNYQWSTYFANNTAFSFTDMALDTHNTVFGATIDGQRRLILNGSMGIAQWEFYHNYALLTTVGRTPIDADDALDSELLFNVLNACSNRALLWFVPKMEILGTIGGISIDKLVFCEFTTQTFAMELAGYTKTDDYIDENGNHQAGEYVTLSDVYFDWWMGIPKTDYLQPTDPNYNPGVPGTVENYLQQSKVIDGETIRLYDAVKAFRFTNPHATSLYDPDIKFGINPLYAGSGQVQPFTEKMLQYMRELANPSDGSRPQLYIHTKIVDIKIDESTIVEEIYLGDTIKYVKFVAIPIETNINEAAKNYVYICAEPQPFKLRVGAHAPHMQIGFGDKHYPAGLGTLSVRVSKSQFEKMVKRGDANPGMLHIPLRDIQVVTPECIGVKAPSYETDPLREVLVTNSTDALMQQRIINWLEAGHSLPPAVGYVDHLHGRDTQYWSEGHPETERLLKLHFNSDFQVREGYSYTLRYRFIEELGDGSDFPVACEGTGDFIIKIVPDYEVWTGGADNTDWSNDENWRRADYDELYAGNGVNLKNRYLPNGSGTQPYTQTNYVTEADRSRRQGFAPLYCTNILMMTSENIGEVETESVNPTSTTTTYKVKPASLLYDDGDEVVNGVKTGFPALRPTASPLIRYDFQAHEWVQDSIKAHSDWTYRALGDMVTELYNDNVCDSIAFQSETELVNAHLLNYNKAWVEFALPKNKWHLVSSPLQGTLSGEWYAPTWSGRQETTYYEPITFDGLPVTSITSASGDYNLGYDRFAPAVYQRQWDKAKAVLYERGAVWSANDASQTENLGEGSQGDWTGQQGQDHFVWDSNNADEYLNRLVYKPFGDSKINVAVRGSWSGAHNDHTVPYDNGGFSVMPINNLKNHNNEDVKTIFRLPKDDQYYDIWDWSKNYGIERRVRVYINDGRPLLDGATATNTVTLNNRGRLRSDFFATPIAAPTTEDPTATVAPEVYEVTLKNEGQGSLGYFLASNPFISGLDMVEFFKLNKDVVKPYYLVMKNSDIDPKNPALNPFGTSWKWTDMSFAGYDGTEVVDDYIPGTNLQGNTIVPPRYAFFVKSKDDAANEITLKYTTKMMVHTPRTVPEGTTTGGGSRLWMTISAQRDGNSSEARVMKSPSASNKFMPEEDLETFVVSDITSNIPVVYTLTGRLATSINRIHDFMVLPIGIESNSDEPATVTFQGVEMLGDSLMLYDAKTGEAVPLHSGFTTRMPGRTQNRFFIVQGSSLKEALAESNLQIFGEDGIIVVTSTTGQPITDVRVYDAGGRQVYVAAPGRNEHRFRLSKGIYVVKANTEDARQVKKISN